MKAPVKAIYERHRYKLDVVPAIQQTVADAELPLDEVLDILGFTGATREYLERALHHLKKIVARNY